MKDVIEIISLGLQTISTSIDIRSVYGNSIKKTLDLFTKKDRELINEAVNSEDIEKNNELKSYITYCLHKTSQEANQDKLKSWKNAIVMLATDFNNYNYKDNLIKTLEDLTVFDLVVLYKIYSTEFNGEEYIDDAYNRITNKTYYGFNNDLFAYFEKEGISLAIVKQSLKRLSTNYLIEENIEAGTPGLLGTPTLNFYTKNDLGATFIKFISELE